MSKEFKIENVSLFTADERLKYYAQEKKFIREEKYAELNALWTSKRAMMNQRADRRYQRVQEAKTI